VAKTRRAWTAGSLVYALSRVRDCTRASPTSCPARVTDFDLRLSVSGQGASLNERAGHCLRLDIASLIGQLLDLVSRLPLTRLRVR
jgi:hypothetical protein